MFEMFKSATKKNAFLSDAKNYLEQRIIGKQGMMGQESVVKV